MERECEFNLLKQIVIKPKRKDGKKKSESYRFLSSNSVVAMIHSIECGIILGRCEFVFHYFYVSTIQRVKLVHLFVSLCIFIFFYVVCGFVLQF